MKPIPWILLSAALFGFILFLLISGRYGKAAATDQRKDTTITINNYYDTNIYNTTTNNINRPSTSTPAPEPLTKYDSSLCDSDRTYNLVSNNDSIDIFSKIKTRGALLSNLVSYKLKMPSRTEIIKEIKVPVPIISRGIYGNIKTTFVTFNKDVCILGEIGLITKSNWMYSIGYSTQNQYSIGIGKVLKKF